MCLQRNGFVSLNRESERLSNAKKIASTRAHCCPSVGGFSQQCVCVCLFLFIFFIVVGSFPHRISRVSSFVPFFADYECWSVKCKV